MHGQDRPHVFPISGNGSDHCSLGLATTTHTLLHLLSIHFTLHTERERESIQNAGGVGVMGVGAVSVEMRLTACGVFFFCFLTREGTSTVRGICASSCFLSVSCSNFRCHWIPVGSYPRAIGNSPSGMNVPERERYMKVSSSY